MNNIIQRVNHISALLYSTYNLFIDRDNKRLLCCECNSISFLSFFELPSITFRLILLLLSIVLWNDHHIRPLDRLHSNYYYSGNVS